MIRKILIISFISFLGFFIASYSLVVSKNSVVQVFGQAPSTQDQTAEEKIEVNYSMPYPGRILPDSALWPLKVFRDKAWLLVAGSPASKSETTLLLANKRVVSASNLMKKDKPELAVATLERAAMYLEESFELQEEAREEGENTGDLLVAIGMSSLKHKEIMYQMLEIAPEDARPVIIKAMNRPNQVFVKVQSALDLIGRDQLVNPFEI